MKRLLLVIVVLALVLSMFLSASMLIGGTRTAPTFALWFTNADGTPCRNPCVFGIEPGVTRFSDVEMLINAHPLSQASDAYEGNSFPGTDIKSFNVFSELGLSGHISFRKANSGLIEQIHIWRPSFGHKQSSFMEALIIFGIPKQVALSYYNNYDENYFQNRNQTLFIQIHDPGPICIFDLAAPISTVYLYEPGYYARFLTEPMAESPPKYFPWVGFSRHRYWQEYYESKEGGYEEWPCNRN